MAQSPRDGVQPLEFMDEAYYAVLGADLAKTGTESLYSPSGLTDIPGLPTQTWYHWGEAWLGAIAISLLRHGAPRCPPPHRPAAAPARRGGPDRHARPPDDRIARRAACSCSGSSPASSSPRRRSRSAWSSRSGCTALAAVAVLLSLYALAVLGAKPASWALAVVRRLRCRGDPAVAHRHRGPGRGRRRERLGAPDRPVAPGHPPAARRRRRSGGRRGWRPAIALVATVGWGVLTGHGIGTSGLSPSIVPFNAFWRETVAVVFLCSGAMLAIVIAWFMVRKEASIEAGLYVGTVALVAAGRSSGGHGSVTSTPSTCSTARSPCSRRRPRPSPSPPSGCAGGRRAGRGLAIALVVICGIQLEAGALFGIGRLQLFGGGRPRPGAARRSWPRSRSLPADAKLAYGCLPAEEAAFWDAQLLGLDAHTGRRVVPMCFESETFGADDRDADLARASPARCSVGAPARALPRLGLAAVARGVATFLKANGIDYIYVDGPPEHARAGRRPGRHGRRDAGASHPLTFGSRWVAGRPTV